MFHTLGPLVHHMHNCVEKYDDEGIDEGDNHPDVHHFNIGSLGHRVEDRDKQGGQGHEDCCIDSDDTFKHIKSNEIICELIDNSQDKGGQVCVQQ